MKREKSLVMPRHVLFFDTETKQVQTDDSTIKQVFKLGSACYYRKAFNRCLEKHTWLDFDNVSSFWPFVLAHVQHKQKLWVIAHNLNFDFTIVNGWKYLNRAGYKIKFFHNTGTTSIVSVKSKQGSIVFIDFMNWFPESLEKIGARLGIPKLKIDFENCTDSQLRIYCRRDVEILLAAFKHFVQFLESGKVARLCFTRASTSMAAYMFGCYEHKIYIHNNSDAIDMERESYRGGRVECFKLGNFNSGNYYMLDVNSLYPAVMYHNDYPSKYHKIHHRIKPQTLSNKLKTYSAVARVLIDTDEPAYAVRRDRTIFPIGRFWVTLCTPELVYALAREHIVKVDRCILYDKAPLFKKFVGKFYALRQDFKSAGMESYDVLVKYLMNSLYGKFGQRAEVWEKIGVCPDEPDRVETLFLSGQDHSRQIRYLLGEIFELTGYEETFNSFPAIAAHVAAFGRMYLYNLMLTAGVGNYFYCDTDSLIVNKTGLKNLDSLIDDTKLGSLKVVERITSLTIHGLKDYSTDTKTVIKGIRKNAVKISDGVFEQERWPSLSGLLRDRTTNDYTVKTQRKVLKRKYTKGNVMLDGLVHPFELDDSEQPTPQLF